MLTGAEGMAFRPGLARCGEERRKINPADRLATTHPLVPVTGMALAAETPPDPEGIATMT